VSITGATAKKPGRAIANRRAVLRVSIVVLLSLASLSSPASPSSPPSPSPETRSVREILNIKNTLTSPDGAFRVGTQQETLKDFRFPVLNLCRALRQRLAYVTNAAADEADVICIELGTPKRNAEGIAVARHKEWISHSVEVADPETVDGFLLEAVLAQCLLNNWLAAAQRKAGTPVREEVPLWFARGLATLADDTPDHSRRGTCFAAVEALQMSGSLRPVPELLEDGGGAHEVSTLLAAWLVETRRNGYAPLSAALANGAAWSETLLLEKWLEMEPHAAQESWDLWLHQCRSKVFKAGVVEAGVWERLRHLLYVYPVDTATLAGDAQRGMTFAELADMPFSPWRRRVAIQRAVALRASAVGRDNVYKEVVEAYCDFLDALQKNESSKSLRARLSSAEARYLAAYAEIKGLNKEQP